MRKIIVRLIFAVIFFIPLAQAEIIVGTLAGLDYAEKTLSNGVRIVVLQQPESTQTLFQVVLSGVGSLIERGDERGYAHLLEHMIFKGTGKLTELSFNDIQAKYGAKTNACTGSEMTAYYAVSSSNNWKPMLKLYVDCLSNARIDDQHLASELNVVIKELRRNNDNPKWQHFMGHYRNCYPDGHPLNGCVIGYKKDLAGVTAEKLQAFYKKYYQPQFMTVFVVGDIEFNDAIDAVEKEMGSIPCGDCLLPKISSDEYLLNSSFHKIIEFDREQNQFSLSWLLPAGCNKKSFAAELLIRCLTQGDSSILVKRLIHEEKCASEIEGELNISQEINHAVLMCQPNEGMQDRCLEIIEEELSKIAHGKLPEDLVNRTQKNINVSHGQLIDNLSSWSVPFDWIFRYVQNNDLNDCFNYAERMNAVTVEEMVEVARDFFVTENMMRVDLIPRKEENKAAQEQALKDDQILEAEILRAHNRTTPLEIGVIPEEYPAVNPIAIKIPRIDSKIILDNRLTLLVKNEKSPLAVAQLTLKAPDLLVKTTEEIALGMLGELIFAATRKMNRSQIEDWFSDLGVQLSVNGLAVNLVGTGEMILPALQKCFEILSSTTFDAVEFQSIKDRTLVGLKECKDNELAVARRAVEQTLYANSVYDWSFDDAISFVESLAVPKMREYFAQHVSPERMILMVSGDVDAAVVQDMVKKSTENWTSTSTLPIIEKNELGDCLQQDVSKHLLRDQTWMFWVSRSDVEFKSPESSVIQVLSEIFRNRTYKLREQSGLFYVIQGVFARFSGRAPAKDFIMLQTGPEFTEKAEALVENFLKIDARAEITAEELESAKNSVITDFVGTFSGLQGRAQWLLWSECVGWTHDEYDQFIESIKSLTVENANKTLKEYLMTRNFVKIKVGNLS
jgi:zinc protease